MVALHSPVVAATLSLHGWDAAWLALAGLAAGIINGLAGGGTLITFPTLLALGAPALTANITSTVGILPGYVGGVTGFRREIADQWSRVTRLAPAAAAGAVVGSVLLLTTPEAAFATIAPWLVLFAASCFALQPIVTRLIEDHPEARSRPRALLVGTFLTSIYGGYFGAGLGVTLLALMALTLPDGLVRMSGLRSVLSVVANGIAAVVFIIHGSVAWDAAGIIAASCLIGGFAGSHLVRQLPAPILRGVIVVIGFATAIKLLA